MNYDVLIIGGGVAGMSCALMLGSAKDQMYATDKKIGIIMHQKTSSLQNALFNNVLGLELNTKGSSILENGRKHLKRAYPHVNQIEHEKVLDIDIKGEVALVRTNKSTYAAKSVVIAIGPKNFGIRGLEEFEELHQNIPPEKKRTQLKNVNHLITNNIYVAGVLAGHRSQFAIAAGSGTSVATDIMCNWNDGKPVKVHDSTII